MRRERRLGNTRAGKTRYESQICPARLRRKEGVILLVYVFFLGLSAKKNDGAERRDVEEFSSRRYNFLFRMDTEEAKEEKRKEKREKEREKETKEERSVSKECRLKRLSQESRADDRERRQPRLCAPRRNHGEKASRRSDPDEKGAEAIKGMKKVVRS